MNVMHSSSSASVFGWSESFGCVVNRGKIEGLYVCMDVDMENCEFGYHVGGLRGRDVGCGCVGKDKRGYGPTRVGDVLRLYLSDSFRRGIRQRTRKM
jgi:hypothetical protein